MSQKRIKVWARIREGEEICSLGCKHQVKYWSCKILTDTGETYFHDNGYEKNRAGIYVDTQGRRYYKQITIDYSGNISYRREDGKLFFPRPNGSHRTDVSPGVARTVY